MIADFAVFHGFRRGNPKSVHYAGDARHGGRKLQAQFLGRYGACISFQGKNSIAIFNPYRVMMQIDARFPFQCGQHFLYYVFMSRHVLYPPFVPRQTG
jgi:hypothetical protein